MGLLEIVTCAVVEKGMEHKGEKFSKTVMQAMEFLWLAKRYK